MRGHSISTVVKISLRNSHKLTFTSKIYPANVSSPMSADCSYFFKSDTPNRVCNRMRSVVGRDRKRHSKINNKKTIIRRAITGYIIICCTVVADINIGTHLWTDTLAKSTAIKQILKTFSIVIIAVLETPPLKA